MIQTIYFTEEKEIMTEIITSFSFSSVSLIDFILMIVLTD